MAEDEPRTTATVKFFNSSNSNGRDLSDTDDDSDASTDDIRRVRSPAQRDWLPETEPVSDEEGSGRPREDSIYDNPTDSPVLTRSSLTRKRTDSGSNLLWADEPPEPNQPLILDATEDHFGLPEDLTRLRDINSEIEKLKQLIYVRADDDAEKKRLIEKLIQLRLRKSELELHQEAAGSETERTKQIYGHDFHEKESSQDTERFCEVCRALVWGVLQTWYACATCHICCHDKCLNSLKRMCAGRRLAGDGAVAYIAAICPDKGLSAQNYKCQECQQPVSYKPGASECRQCDYTGLYYCSACHWNDEAVIPARVLANWDFEPRPVCRASKQYLQLVYRKPVISLERTHPHLFRFIEELNEMRKLREEILLMKMYFLSCQSAMQNKILLQLRERQHFVENAGVYSLADLVELVEERLLPAVINVHAVFASHIKVDCQTCRGKGYICEICQKQEVIFPFDNVCISCAECSNVFHKHCHKRAQGVCPRCERKRRRQEESQRKAFLLKQIEVNSGAMA